MNADQSATLHDNAEKLEGEIESTQEYLLFLFDELKRRFVNYFNLKSFIFRNKIPIIIGVIIFSRMMFPNRKKTVKTRERR